MIGGIKGVRVLTSAYADVLLRQRGMTRPRKIKWGNRRGRPWTEGEIDQASAMRMRGSTDAEIATALNRTVSSIAGKIGYVRAA